MKQCIKFTFVAFNVLILISGIGTVALGIFVLVDKAFFDPLIGGSLLPIAAYVLIGAGSVISLISLAGCFGALSQSKALLGIYFSTLLVLFLAEAAAGVLGFYYYDQALYYVNLFIGVPIRQNYGDSNYKLVNTAVDMMHREFKCCGLAGPDDWLNSAHFNSTNMAVPTSCCLDQNEVGCNTVVHADKTYTKGCADALIGWIQNNLKIVGGVAIGVAVIQLFGMTFSMILCKKVDEDEFV